MTDPPPPNTDPSGHGTACNPPPRSVQIVPVGPVVLAGVVDRYLTYLGKP